MRRITLKNEFHGRETVVEAEPLSGKLSGIYEITREQWRAAKRRLCHHAGCECIVRAPGYAIEPAYALVLFEED